uniref:ATP synthase F0 subunit 8 n=1 Tax=Cryptochiton stelleri TaxID=6655 RepID=A0A0E3DEF9_CRYST|nr:ATP synthase F0 subunit 8 [Cryptochiton stelleri]AIA77080.1 ATP synthase F0 subunit 8 [Cryptochiton stelleri]
MPQLAPMNWIFLVLFFWMSVFFLSVCLWWVKDKNYVFFNKSGNKGFIQKKWVW